MLRLKQKVILGTQQCQLQVSFKGSLLQQSLDRSGIDWDFRDY